MHLSVQLPDSLMLQADLNGLIRLFLVEQERVARVTWSTRLDVFSPEAIKSSHRVGHSMS